jgi:hypothetical protein
MGYFSGQELDESALPGAGLANEKHEVALVNLQRYVPQAGNVARIFHLNILKLYVGGRFTAQCRSSLPFS